MSDPSPGVAYSVTLRAEYPNNPGMLAQITTAVSNAGGDAAAIDVVSSSSGIMVRDFTVNATSIEHGELITAAVQKVPYVKIKTVSDPTFLLHIGGKIEMQSRVAVATRDDMSKAYTPGVGRVCLAIKQDPAAVWSLTSKGHTVAIVSDGSAVLGLGDIGANAALPVMEGKALLFKEFGGVDAWPIVVDTNDTEEIISVVKAIAPGFGGINLEDISAPRCFEIEKRLKEELDIPVFHDDQHGTAVVVLAGLINSLKLIKKKPEELKVIVAGAGASGTACIKILLKYGVKNITGFDRNGSISKHRDYGNNSSKEWLAQNTNPDNVDCTLAEGLVGADFFLGLAGPDLVKPGQIERMGTDAIVFALSNPDPEIWPEDIPDNVRIMATGRTDYPNQINNSLCFPGLFRGVLDVRATEINDEMKIASAKAIADVIPQNVISEDFVIPSVFDERVASSVSDAVALMAQSTSVARRRRRRGRNFEDDHYATRRIAR